MGFEDDDDLHARLAVGGWTGRPEMVALSPSVVASTMGPTVAFAMEIRSVEAIVGALSSAQVKYVVVGGLAVIAHGYERLTKDVDLVIGLEPENIIRGLHALEGIGYRAAIPVTAEQFANPATRDAWRRDKQMVVLKLWNDTHRRTPIDVFVYEPFDFARELAAATWMDFSGPDRVPILSLQPLLAMKRAAGRPQDLADVAALEEIHNTGTSQ